MRDGEIWIPVEATLVATSFSEAWVEGARRYRAAEALKQVQVVSLRRAWERFPPATLAPAKRARAAAGFEDFLKHSPQHPLARDAEQALAALR